MVFKRGVILMALAVSALMVTAQAEQIAVNTHLKHPVVKSVSHNHGKVQLVLNEGTTVHHKKVEVHQAVTKHDAKKAPVKKITVKKPVVVKVAPKKGAVKKHSAVKKPAHKQVSMEKKDGELIKTYPHGQVHVTSKSTATDAHKKVKVHKPVAKKPVVKKLVVKKPVVKKPVVHKPVVKKPVVKKPVVHKPVVKKPVVKKPVKVIDDVDEADVDLKEGESVSLEFAGHTVDLELLKNGSLSLTADGVTHILPHADSIDLTVSDDDSEESAEGSSDGSSSEESSEIGEESSAEGSEEGVLSTVEKDVSNVAKKFTELATKMTGDGKFFSKDAAPVVFVGGVIGALAAIVGIAAIAVGRTRSSSAADPASVLAEATEDVDVEAGVTAEETNEDEAAEESQSLDGSDSESDADVEEDKEEGKFMNEGSV